MESVRESRARVTYNTFSISISLSGNDQEKKEGTVPHVHTFFSY